MSPSDLQRELGLVNNLQDWARAQLYGVRAGGWRAEATTAVAASAAEETYRLTDQLPEWQNETTASCSAALAAVARGVDYAETAIGQIFDAIDLTDEYGTGEPEGFARTRSAGQRYLHQVLIHLPDRLCAHGSLRGSQAPHRAHDNEHELPYAGDDRDRQEAGRCSQERPGHLIPDERAQRGKDRTHRQTPDDHSPGQSASVRMPVLHAVTLLRLAA